MNGGRIKQERLHLGLTLLQLAERTGYTPSFISQIERNLRQPSLSALRKFADALGRSVVWFLVDDEPERKPKKSIGRKAKERFVIRQSERRIVNMPEIDIHYEVITPPISAKGRRPRMTGMYLKMRPGQWVSEASICHQDMDESVFLIQGSMKAILDGETFLLGPGDSLFIPAGTEHNYFNAGRDDDLIMLMYNSAFVI